MDNTAYGMLFRLKAYLDSRGARSTILAGKGVVSDVLSVSPLDETCDLKVRYAAVDSRVHASDSVMPG